MTHDYRHRVGARIRAHREQQGLTQTELAKQIGVADAQISRWENGRAMPIPRYLEAIAEALGVRPEAFFINNSA